MIEFDAGNISISLYLIITCASLSINSSAAKRLFTECNDKEYTAWRDKSVSTEALYLYLSYGCLRREILILQLCRRWITHSHIFFSSSRSGQRWCPRERARAFNILFLVFLSRWLTRYRGCTCWISHTHSDYSRSFSLLFFSFSLSLSFSLHLAYIRCNSVAWVEYRFQSLSQSF